MLLCEFALGFDSADSEFVADLCVMSRALCHTAGSFGRQEENMERVSDPAGPRDQAVSPASERDGL